MGKTPYRLRLREFPQPTRLLTKRLANVCLLARDLLSVKASPTPFGRSLASLVYYGDLVHDLGPRKTFGIAAFQKPCGPLPARFAALDPGKPSLKSLCLCPLYRYAKLGIAFAPALYAITRNVFKRRRLFVG